MILALPHCGNWDFGRRSGCVDHGSPLSTVAERLKPESLYERFVAYRESLGMEVLPLTGGERPPSDVLKDRLREGRRAVCLLADRDLTARGVDVEFFGAHRADAGRPGAAGRCAPGRRCCRSALWFTPGGWGIRIHPEVPIAGTGRLRDKVAAATQELADAFATDIAEHPHDWHMLQRLWLSDLPAQTGPVRTSSAARGDRMRIGIVCPYSLDVPGGVQAHVRDLAEALIVLGHEVTVLAPADEDTPPAAVRRSRPGGRCRCRYNGSVARLQFGPVSAARVRRWLREGEFDVLHVHEPSTLSLSLLAVLCSPAGRSSPPSTPR